MWHFSYLWLVKIRELSFSQLGLWHLLNNGQIVVIWLWLTQDGICILNSVLHNARRLNITRIHIRMIHLHNISLKLWILVIHIDFLPRLLVHSHTGPDLLQDLVNLIELMVLPRGLICRDWV